MEIFLQIIVNGILTASLYALVAGGLSFLYATTKIFHLAHGVVTLGAGYTFWWLWISLGWHPLAAVLGALVMAVLVGLLTNELVYEILRRKGTKGLGYLIAALALLILGTGFILALFGGAPKTFQFQTQTFAFGDVHLTVLQLWTIVIALLLLGAFFYLSKYTKLGKAMRATADNEIVAQILGVNTRNIRRLAFILSSILAAAAGILLGLEFNLDPNMGVLLTLKGFAAAVIGGVGSLGGAILGSLIIGVGEQFVVWFLTAGWRNAVTFILLFIFLLFKPTGLLGERREL